MTATPEWFIDATWASISRGDITPFDGLMLAITPPSWVFHRKPEKDYMAIPDPDEQSFVCSDCWACKPVSDFYVRPSDGRRWAKCRSCSAVDRSVSRWKDIDSVRAYDRSRKRNRHLVVAA